MENSSKAILCELHDAEIIGISFDRQSARFQTDLRLLSGREVSFSCVDSVYFRAEGMIHQNVVLRGDLSSGPPCDREYIKSRLKWLTSRTDESSFLTDADVLKWVDEIVKGTAALVQLVPSFGVEVCVLSKDARLLNFER